MMKNSIKTVGGVYNTSRMLCDYLNNLYIPQIRLANSSYANKEEVEQFSEWKNNLIANWNNVSISSSLIGNEVSINAGNSLELSCTVSLGNIPPESVSVEVYYGRFINGEKILNSAFKEMTLANDLGNSTYEYKTSITIDNGGNYGYTFRILPNHDMLISKHDMSLVKWLES